MKILTIVIVINCYLFLTACQPQAAPIPPTRRIPLRVTATATATSTLTPTSTASATLTAKPTQTHKPTLSPSPSIIPSTPTVVTPSVAPTALEPTTEPTKEPIMESASKITIGLVGNLAPKNIEALTSNSLNLNPLYNLNPTLSQLSHLLYQPFMQINPLTAKLETSTLNLPTLSNNGLTLTYTRHLSPLNLIDIKHSLETTIWPELSNIRHINLIDKNTLVITLTQANCAIIENLAPMPILSAKHAESPIPTANGPFKLENIPTENDTTLQFIVNPTVNSSIKPQLNQITVKLFENENSAWQALVAGELDVLPLKYKPQSLPPNYYSLPYPAPVTTFISFSNKETLLDTIKVRQALSLALNRQQILDVVFKGDGTLLSSILLPTHWAADSTLTPPTYNPEEAIRLLEAVGLQDKNGDGWRDWPPTHTPPDGNNGDTWHVGIRVNGANEAETQIALLVAEFYRQVGIKARAEIISFDTLSEDLMTQDYQIAVYSLPALAPLDYHNRWHSTQIEAELGSNLALYANPQLDAWLDEANQVPNCNSTQRATLYQKIQTHLAETRPVDFLITPTYFIIVREGIEGIKPGPFVSFMWNVAEWQVVE